jgi:hypothetical protein|tara:strand:- start:20 stop:139 length:120 start_codon:yes stop_codon:yes gene_type:complete
MARQKSTKRKRSYADKARKSERRAVKAQEKAQRKETKNK